jgi:hypothetical protein
VRLARPILVVAVLVATGEARPVGALSPGAATEVALARVRAAAGCAPGRLARTIDRALARTARHLARAGVDAERGVHRRAERRLARAARTLGATRARVVRLDGRGKLPDGCGPLLREALDALLADDAPAPAPTTTIPASTTSTSRAPASTTTTSLAPTTTTLAVPSCGNGRLDPGEQCDGTNLFGRTCLTLRFNGGELGCRPDCIFDVRRCTL